MIKDIVDSFHVGSEALEIFERQSHPILAKDAAKYLTTCLHGDSQRTAPFQINEHLYMSVNSRNAIGAIKEHICVCLGLEMMIVVLLTHLRKSLDFVTSDIHFSKQLIVEKIPSVVTLDH